MVKVERTKAGHFVIQAPAIPKSADIRTWDVLDQGIAWLRQRGIAVGQNMTWGHFRTLRDLAYVVPSKKKPQPRIVRVKPGKSTGRVHKPVVTLNGVFTSYYEAPVETSSTRPTPRAIPTNQADQQSPQHTPGSTQSAPPKPSKKGRKSAPTSQRSPSRQTIKMETIHSTSVRMPKRNREIPDQPGSDNSLSAIKSHNKPADLASLPHPFEKQHHPSERPQVGDKFSSEEIPPHLARKTKKRNWFSNDD